VLNKTSTLQRQSIAINDPSLPLQFEHNVRVDTVYVPEKYSGEFRYRGQVKVQASEAITAYEVRIITFDVFGNRLKTLSATEVGDLASGTMDAQTPEWRVWSENEASEYFASVAFIAYARTAAGKVYSANIAAVLEEARKIGSKLTSEQLEPDKPPVK